MTRAHALPLLGGPYQNRSLISGAQRCVNMYPEQNPPEGQPPVPVTHFLTSGLRKLAQCPLQAGYRGLYLSTIGVLFAVVGPNIYSIDAYWNFTFEGSINNGSNPVGIIDNGLAMVITDGTVNNGWAVDLTNPTFPVGVIPGGGPFYGSTRVEYIDTFFLFNRPGTNQWYSSLSNVTYTQLTSGVGSFDPTYIAAKTGTPDQIASIIAVRGELWLLGALRGSETWVDAGNPGFPFQRLPGAVYDHGTAAPYSACKVDTQGFFIAIDKEGRAMALSTDGYSLRRITTHAIEQEWTHYGTLSDCIGYTRQEEGHVFVVFIFPTADKTWVYELETNQWHEWNSADQDGNLHRHRVVQYATAYNTTVGGDYQNGALYQIDQQLYDDAGTPIQRIRTIPHLVKSGEYVKYESLIANMEVGQGLDPTADVPLVSLRWSDDRGATYGNPVTRSMGAPGEFLTSIRWNKLGRARDRVFELSWSAPIKTALNGVFIASHDMLS